MSNYRKALILARRWPRKSAGLTLAAVYISALAAALFTMGCARKSIDCARRLDRDLSGMPRSSPQKSPAATPLSERSLYQLESSWTNDTGASLSLVTLKGRPQVVCLFFASCEFACPVLVHDMKRIQDALPANLRTNVGFVLISFDSDRDTPAVLAEYRKKHQLPANWTLLRGAPDDVLELAALLGVKFKKDARGQFAYSNLLTLLNAGGEVAHQQAGLNRPTAEIVSQLNRLLQP